MTSITMTLSDEQSQKARQTADELGISPEELLRVSLEDLLARPNAEFVQAANYVRKKNAELHRRLA